MIAAGGIVDARGMVAAMVLGAEGVQLGTRFVAVNESIAHPAYKQAIINAKDTDTLIPYLKTPRDLPQGVFIRSERLAGETPWV